MFDYIYTWVKQIASFLILMTVIRTVVPKNAYSKYLNLFLNLILVLLLIRPMLEIVNASEDIPDKFAQYAASQEIDEINGQIALAESDQKQALIRKYEDIIAEQIERVAGEASYLVDSVSITFDEDTDSETYGTVLSVSLTLSEEESEAKEVVAPVVIGAGATVPDAAAQDEDVNVETDGMKTQIASILLLEPSCIEIQIRRG